MWQQTTRFHQKARPPLNVRTFCFAFFPPRTSPALGCGRRVLVYDNNQSYARQRSIDARYRNGRMPCSRGITQIFCRRCLSLRDALLRFRTTISSSAWLMAEKLLARNVQVWVSTLFLIWTFQLPHPYCTRSERLSFIVIFHLREWSGKFRIIVRLKYRILVMLGSVQRRQWNPI